jgi:hypothetical protein
MSQVHFGLQGFEIVRHICLGLTPHSLPGPLLETIQFFIDVHLSGLIVELKGTAPTEGALAEEIIRRLCAPLFCARLVATRGVSLRMGIDTADKGSIALENAGIESR